MFVERNVFYLKFGAGRTALQLWSDFLQAARKADDKIRVRLLTDLSGPAYVLVLELTYDKYADLEPALCPLTRHADWKDFYAQFTPLCERAERILYRIV